LITDTRLHWQFNLITAFVEAKRESVQVSEPCCFQASHTRGQWGLCSRRSYHGMMTLAALSRRR
jgi:hypothetical protein